MLKKNCNKVFGSLKSKLTALEQVFQTADVINPPCIRDRVKTPFRIFQSADDL